MKYLFVNNSDFEKYKMRSKDGLQLIEPIHMQEGFGIPIHILENENYSWAWEKLSELTPMEMTPLPAPTLEEILGGKI